MFLPIFDFKCKSFYDLDWLKTFVPDGFFVILAPFEGLFLDLNVEVFNV